ncbi:MAG: DsbA family protein [Acidimicrobiia bacterium]
MPSSLRVTWDYLCPFARNAHTMLVEAIRTERITVPVAFHAFSLTQNHVEVGEPSVWDRLAGARGSGVLALEWGIAVRDHFPDAFLNWHVQMYAARHDSSLDINDPNVLRDVAVSCDLEPDAIERVVATGEPIATLRDEHTEAVDRWSVFGVPTFISDDEAVFIRFMSATALDDLERAIALLDATNINEFKHTTVPR